MVATLKSGVNHLVTGRRGVGNSTTLAVLQRRAQAEGARVILADVEHHKARQYPDVLIEIIIDILKEIQPNRWAWSKSQRVLRQQVKKLLAGVQVGCTVNVHRATVMTPRPPAGGGAMV
jgi:hypothetical protein